MPDQLINLIPMVHAGATWFMTGLIWFVQIVHYPLMGAVPAGAFSAYERAHQRRTTWVVGPVMIFEAGTALLLVWTPEGGLESKALGWTGLALLTLVWISTFAVQVPLHVRLASGFDKAVWRRLVTTNWVRTIAWSARGTIAFMLLG